MEGIPELNEILVRHVLHITFHTVPEADGLTSAEVYLWSSRRCWIG
jgi:hypothetical protein